MARKAAGNTKAKPKGKTEKPKAKAQAKPKLKQKRNRPKKSPDARVPPKSSKEAVYPIDKMRDAAYILAYNQWKPGHQNGVLNMAADAADVSVVTMRRWANGKENSNETFTRLYNEAKLRIQKMGVAAFENLRKMEKDTTAQIYLAKIAFPDMADDQMKRQERQHQRKLELSAYEAELTKKLQEERPPIKFEFVEVEGGEEPDLEGLINDEEET